jgi:uncharacterized RDD family membrane protein YckC
MEETENYPYAPLFSRGLAIIVDAFVLIGLWMLISIPLAFILISHKYFNPLLDPIRYITFLAIMYSYYVFFEAYSGQTFGKKLLKRFYFQIP